MDHVTFLATGLPRHACAFAMCTAGIWRAPYPFLRFTQVFVEGPSSVAIDLNFFDDGGCAGTQLKAGAARPIVMRAPRKGVVAGDSLGGLFGAHLL